MERGGEDEENGGGVVLGRHRDGEGELAPIGEGALVVVAVAEEVPVLSGGRGDGRGPLVRILGQ